VFTCEWRRQQCGQHRCRSVTACAPCWAKVWCRWLLVLAPVPAPGAVSCSGPPPPPPPPPTCRKLSLWGAAAVAASPAAATSSNRIVRSVLAMLLVLRGLRLATLAVATSNTTSGTR
jgi:hypothetical protein